MKLSKRTLFLYPLLLGLSLLPIHAEDSSIATSNFDLTNPTHTCIGSNLAELTADAMRQYASSNSPYKKVDVALVSEQVFTGSIPAGDITETQIQEAIADVKMVEMNVPGKYLILALEKSSLNAPNQDSNFLTSSNVSYVIDPSQPGIPEDSRYSESFARNLALTLGEKDTIEWFENYRIVIDATALSYFEELLGEEMKYVVEETEAVSLPEVVTYYLQTTLKGQVPTSYKSPYGDGRLKVITPSTITYNEEEKDYSFSVDQLQEGITWIAVPESVLNKRLQGIIGNRLYRGTFMATFDGEEIACDETRYNVIVPVTAKQGTFSLKYNEIIGNTVNLMILLGATFMMSMTFLLFMASNRKKTRQRSIYRK